MSQSEDCQEIELVDIVHFIVNRWKRMLLVTLLVTSIVFLGLVAKTLMLKNYQVEQLEVVSLNKVEDKKYKSAALVEIPRIAHPDGHLWLIENFQFLTEAYQSEGVKLTLLPVLKGERSSNGLLISSENTNSGSAEEAVMRVVDELIKEVEEKELTLRENKHKKYVVIGNTRLVKYELIEPEPEPKKVVEPVFEIKMLLKAAFLSLLIGAFASLVYLAFAKVRLDYLRKYPS